MRLESWVFAIVLTCMGVTCATYIHQEQQRDRAECLAELESLGISGSYNLERGECYARVVGSNGSTLLVTLYQYKLNRSYRGVE